MKRESIEAMVEDLGQNRGFESLAEIICAKRNIDYCAKVDLKAIRTINKVARLTDQSHLYPYIECTERAIRWYRRVYFAANGHCSVGEYIAGLNIRMDEIVNGGA